LFAELWIDDRNRTPRNQLSVTKIIKRKLNTPREKKRFDFAATSTVCYTFRQISYTVKFSLFKQRKTSYTKFLGTCRTDWF
jgi:hypothetical protein